MNVHAVVRNFNKATRNIRTVIGYTFKVIQKVGKDKSQFYRAFLTLKPKNMLCFEIILQIIDNLLKRFDFDCNGKVIFFKSRQASSSISFTASRSV